MAISEGEGLPISVHITRASHHEVNLVEPTFETLLIDGQPERLIGDKAYDSDPLDERLRSRGDREDRSPS